MKLLVLVQYVKLRVYPVFGGTLGNSNKPEKDFFYKRQSGLSQISNVYGSLRNSVQDWLESRIPTQGRIIFRYKE